MGYTFAQGASRQDAIADFIKPWTGGDGKTRRPLAHCTRGNVLWAVWEIDGDPSTRFISCSILAKDHGFGWGRKDMSESMGPAYHSCPTSYLDMVPMPESKYAQNWREKVRQHNRMIEAKKRMAKVHKAAWKSRDLCGYAEAREEYQVTTNEYYGREVHMTGWLA